MDRKPTYEELERRILELENLHKRSVETGSDTVYRLLLESNTESVVITDDSGRITYFCPKTSALFGISDEKVNNCKYIHRLLGNHIFQITDLKEHGEINNIEWEIEVPNGQIKNLLINVQSANLPNGSVSYVMRDITEFHKAGIQLKETAVKYENIFNNLIDTYVETSIDGTILEISPSIERLIGYTREEMLGTSGIKHYEKSNDRKRHVQELKTKGHTRNYDLALYHKNGSLIPVSVSSVLNKDNQGNEYIISMVRNESERKKIELMLRKSEKRLRQAQKMESIGILAGGIAHDFNNILTSIIGFTELALDEAHQGTDLEDNLQEVYSAGKRARDLVQQILAFARQSDEENSPLQPSMVAKEVLMLIRSTIPTTIEIRQNIECDSWILGNTSQIHQVFMNLCTNATYAMEESGGVLDVGLKGVVIDDQDLSIGMRPGDYIEIKVSDTGTGIAPEIIELIFEPYFTTKGPGEGTGMGLAMTQGVIENCGGKITVDSQKGKGTTFTIYLPITKKRSLHGAYVPEQLPTGTERILFVDDEYPIVKMGRQILERLGYSVTTRTSSIDALELFRTNLNDFDLIVTDMTMPNLTGDKLAVELMKIRRDIPVIIFTGYSKKISDESASEIGIRALAYKPIVKVDLATTVRKVLDEAKN